MADTILVGVAGEARFQHFAEEGLAAGDILGVHELGEGVPHHIAQCVTKFQGQCRGYEGVGSVAVQRVEDFAGVLEVAAQPQLAGTGLLLSSHPVGDVHEHREMLDNVPGFVAKHRHGQLPPDQAPVLVDIAFFECKAVHLAAA